MGAHSDHRPKQTNFKIRILWRKGLGYGGKMHSHSVRLSVLSKFNDWFAVLRGKILQNFEALFYNNSVKDSLSIHER